MFSEFRQGVFELRLWPDKMADGNVRSTTPGLLSDVRESEMEDGTISFPNSHEDNILHETKNNVNNVQDEFPILDELDRLAKVRYVFCGCF